MPAWRVIAVAIIHNEQGEYLICKKPANRGVFAGQWALPGGGIEPGEHMEAALRREVREEVGLEVLDVTQLFFKDGQYPKHYPDGTIIDVYMIFLLFGCLAANLDVHLGEEFEKYAWVRPEDLHRYELNEQTKASFIQMGIYQ